MKIFRLKYVVETLSLFTMIIFLNMSFVLAEVSALKTDQDNAIIKSIAALISGCASDTHTPHSIDILSKDKAKTTTLGVPRLGNYEIFSPPPEA